VLEVLEDGKGLMLFGLAALFMAKGFRDGVDKGGLRRRVGFFWGGLRRRRIGIGRGHLEMSI